ncbi:MAG: hypothetical protein NVSMB18_10010 [Acetobacteraceae bacterium]
MSATTLPAPGAAATRRVGKLESQRRLALWGSYAALSLFVVFFLIPPIYMLITSFKTSAEIGMQSGSPWLLRNPTLSNYTELLQNRNFLTFFWNSIKVTGCLVVLSMVISVLAAFSLARMKF